MTFLRARTLAAPVAFALLVYCAAPVSARTHGSAVGIGGPEAGPALLPTGYYETATAAPGSRFLPLETGLRPDGNADASDAVTTALSPDGSTLLVLTSGYNYKYNTPAGTPIVHPVLDPRTGKAVTTSSNGEWVFVYDVRASVPVLKERINIPNTYDGLVWDPSGKTFYVSGGIDDRIYVYGASGAEPSATPRFAPSALFVLLGHNTDQNAPFPHYDGGQLKKLAATHISTGAVVAGFDISRDGSLLAAANFENDSVSLIDPKTRRVLGEIPFFRPGGTLARGEFPYWVAVRSVPSSEAVPAQIGRPSGSAKRPNESAGTAGSPAEVYVSSQRDDEVLGVDLLGRVHDIKTGKAPNRMILSKSQSRLYVANGDSDTISVIDTSTDTVIGTIPVYRDGDRYRGASPNALALSPDERYLYVTLGNEKRSASSTRMPTTSSVAFRRAGIPTP